MKARRGQAEARFGEPGAGRIAAKIGRDLAAHGSLVVALSGGVDSAVVAALAWRALGDRALAATAAAETLASRELEQARRVALEIGIRHRVIPHSELAVSEFVANPAHRCYVCQGLRMDLLRELAREEGYAAVADGTNASDLGPERPGLRAIKERGIVSPLMEHGVRKPEVRVLARWLGLSVWDRPANACLSSRIPHGQLVTLGKLNKIEEAEEIVMAGGFRKVRVRLDGGSARIEVDRQEVGRLRQAWPGLLPRLEALGFTRVTFDPAGYRYGGADGGEEARHRPQAPEAG